MRFSCESCGAQYMISDDKVGPGGVKVRCKKCGNVIPVRGAAGASADAAPAAVTAARGETDVDHDLEQAFQNVLGGGSIAAGEASAPEPQAAAGADLASDWYVAIDDRQVGPIPASGVRSRWEAGEIGPDTLAWCAGMSDWSPLASIPEMTRFLAGSAARTPGASQPRTNVAAESPLGATAPATPSTVNGTNGKVNGHDGAWQPSAASALAALAAQELTPSSPEPLPGAPAASAAPTSPSASSGSSLLDRLNLPEGGVDPTHLIPLPMKGVETTEVDLKPKAVEPERTEIRQIRKQAKRSGAAMGIAAGTAIAAAIGVAVWLFRPALDEHPAPSAVTAAPAPAAPQPAAAPAAPATAAAPVAPSAPAVPATTSAAPSPSTPPGNGGPAAATASAAAPQAAAPQASPAAPAPPEARAEHPVASAKAAQEAPAPPAAERAPTHRPTRAEIAEAKKAARRERLAAAAAAAKPPPRAPAPEPAANRTQPPPAPAVAAAPSKKSGDPLLDVGGDDDLEKELSSSKPKRSVYVPPAMGSDLPSNVSVSQINEAVVGQKSALLRCIEQQRAADPNARGTLKVRWIIGGDGAPRDVAVLSDEFAKQPIGTCISGVVKGIRFPRSRTAGQEVVFPFKF